MQERGSTSGSRLSANSPSHRDRTRQYFLAIPAEFSRPMQHAIGSKIKFGSSVGYSQKGQRGQAGESSVVLFVSYVSNHSSPGCEVKSEPSCKTYTSQADGTRLLASRSCQARVDLSLVRRNDRLA